MRIYRFSSTKFKIKSIQNLGVVDPNDEPKGSKWWISEPLSPRKSENWIGYSY